MSSHERFEQLNFKFFSGKSFQSAESDLLRTKRVGKVFEPTGADRRSKQNTSQNQPSSSSSQTLFESSIHDSSKSGWERKSEPWWISSTCRQQVPSLKKFILQNKIVQHCWQKGCLLCQFTTSSRSFKFSFVKYKGLLFHLRPRWTKSNLKRKKVTLDVFYICALFYLLDVILDFLSMISSQSLTISVINIDNDFLWIDINCKFCWNSELKTFAIG